MERIYVILSADKLEDRIKNLIDKGMIAEANQAYYQVKSFHQKVLAFLQEKGLTAYSTIPCRLMFECNETDAEEIPLFMMGYKQSTECGVSCGIGLDWDEAAKALKKSRVTGDMEMYDPKLMKNDGFSLDLPINHSDPKVHEYREPAKEEEEKAVLIPDAKQQLQIEQGYLQAVAAQFMPQQQPQMPQQQPQQQEQGQRKSLLETLTGEQQPQGQAPDQSGQTGPEEKSEEIQTEASPEAKSDLDKIGASLASIKEHIPQLMDLAEKNPDAFKQTVNMVQKMLALAKQRVSKSEVSGVEELTKKINSLGHLVGVPVGTQHKGKKKVIVNGKAVWRSMGAGMIQDSQGNAISVKSHNRQAEANSQGG